MSKVARAFLLDNVTSLNHHEHQGSYWRKTALPWTILEEKFPVPRNNAAGKLGNGVILLLWQLRCHCNPDHNQEPIIGSYHNKFSSLSETTVVAIFPNLCGDVRSLCSNSGGMDPEKLYRATLKQLQNCNNTQKTIKQISVYKNYKITTV